LLVEERGVSVDDTPKGEISPVLWGIPLARVVAEDIELSYALPPGRADRTEAKVHTAAQAAAAAG
jgi:hypothetical protein